MHFSQTSVTALTGLLFSSPIFAAPVVEPAALVVPTIVSADVAPVDSTGLEKRKGRTFCKYWVSDDLYGGAYYHVFHDGWGNNDETSRSGCGGGFLDNLRGQCATPINGWGCAEEHSSPHSTKTSFYFTAITLVGKSHCVEDALWLASPGNNRDTGVQCEYVSPGFPWLWTCLWAER